MEDEKHVLLICPAYNSLRAAYAARLPSLTGGDMASVMGCSNQRDLAAFIFELRERYVDVHDKCVDALACEKCGKADRPTVMLLCDGPCGRAYHMDCLDPKVLFRPKHYCACFCPPVCPHSPPTCLSSLQCSPLPSAPYGLVHGTLCHAHM